MKSLCECSGAKVALNATFMKFVSNLAIDAGIVEQWKAHFKNSMLGPGYGWLATIAGHPPAEVVPACHWAACVE